MPTYHSITLRFIRRRVGGFPETNPNLDDTLRVQKLGENNLRVTYTERSEDGAVCDTTIMTYQRFFQYVWRILWLLSMDTDPFLSVQLIIPGYPMVLISVATISQNMATIMDILMTTCWQWPVVGRIPVEEASRVSTTTTENSGPPPLESASTTTSGTHFEA